MFGYAKEIAEFLNVVYLIKLDLVWFSLVQLFLCLLWQMGGIFEINFSISKPKTGNIEY